MEQPKYLIDSNAVIDYLGHKLPPSGMEFMDKVFDAIPNVSVVTKIEVLGFNTQPQHYKILSDFIKDTIVFDLTENVVTATIEIRKKHKAKLPDAIIAATAVVYDLVLISRNTIDFRGIRGLLSIDPHLL